MHFNFTSVHKSFGDKRVLEGVSFSARSGSALGLLGRNGAGKTTSIRIIMGVFPADSGQITVDGKPIDRNHIRFGYLPEEHGLYPKVKIGEQLCYLGRLGGMTAHDAKASVEKWMKRLELDGYLKKNLDTLSKGNQQKVQLVAALIRDPEFVILDEPFSGLDPVNAATLKDIVKEQIGEGRLVLFSSHQMGYVEEFCDSVAILHGGKIVLSGGINDIKRSYPRDSLTVTGTGLLAAERLCTGELRQHVAAAESFRGKLSVKLTSPAAKQVVMKALTAGGFDIDSVSVDEPTLNDIFVEYTS